MEEVTTPKEGQSGRWIERHRGYADDPCDALLGYHIAAVACLPNSFAHGPPRRSLTFLANSGSLPNFSDVSDWRIFFSAATGLRPTP